MFTTVEEEVRELESDWLNEPDLMVLCARLTIRLDGLRARFRQGRVGFSAANIMSIEGLFERLDSLEQLQKCLVALDLETHPKRSQVLVNKCLRLLRAVGPTAAGQTARAELSELHRALHPDLERKGWQPFLKTRYDASSSSRAAFTC